MDNVPNRPSGENPSGGATAHFGAPPTGRIRAWILIGIAIAATTIVGLVAAKARDLAQDPRPQAGRADDGAALGDGPQALLAGRALLPTEPVRFVGVDGDGTVWFRVIASRGGEDRVIAISGDESRRVYPNLRAAVQSNYRAILQQGALADFWAVDPSDNVWVGPAFFNGRIWQPVAGDGLGLGSLSYEDRVAIDGDGNAWVPYRIQEGCAQTTDCESAGIAAFNAKGEMVGDIVLDLAPELQRRDLPFVRFETGDDRIPFALGTQAAFRLPSVDPQIYPGLDFDPNTGTRRAGFGSAAAITPDGHLAAFTRVEPPRGAPDPELSELTWQGASWQASDLGASPLFANHSGSRFVTAAVYDLEGRLWIAASSAELAARRGNRWEHHFDAANSPIDALITDLAVGPDGTLWVGTTKGARSYLDGDWRTAVSAFLPRLDLCVGPFGERECN